MGNKICCHPRVILTEDIALHFKSSNLVRDVSPIIDKWRKEGAELCFELKEFEATFDVVVDTERQFQVFDTDRNGRVDAHEVLMVYILLASGEVGNKVDMVFSVFDFVGSRGSTGTINFDEAVIMFTACVRGLQKVCESDFEVPDDEIVFHCKSMFDMHRIPHSGRLSKKFFKDWVLGDSGPRAFVHLFHDAQGLPDIHAQVQQRSLEQAAVFQMLAHGRLDVTAQALFGSQELRKTLGDASDSEMLALLGLMFDDEDKDDESGQPNLLPSRSTRLVGRPADSPEPQQVPLWCQRIAGLIEDLLEDREIMSFFGKPVDIQRTPNYLRRIAPNKPIDLHIILCDLQANRYIDMGKVYNSISMVWDNAAKNEQQNARMAEAAERAKRRWNEMLLHVHAGKQIRDDRFHEVLRPWNVFNECDLDGSHFLDTKELEIILWFQLRRKPPQSLLKAFIDFVDVEQKGGVSRQEWVTAILESEHATKRPQNRQFGGRKDENWFRELIKAG